MQKPWLDEALAANGRPVWENFGQWFERSKVLDPKGSPLVVFRGEHGEDGGEPRTNLASITFTDDSAVAGVYAMEPNDRKLCQVPAAPHLMPAYLSIKNPIIHCEDPFAEFSDLVKKLGSEDARRLALQFAEHIENTNNWLEKFAGYNEVKELIDAEPGRIGELYMNAYPLLDDPDFIELAKSKGFDGAIHMGNGASFGAMEYRVFDKNQIKSAVGNRGLYLDRSASVADQQQPVEAAKDLDALSKAKRAKIVAKEYDQKVSKHTKALA